MRILIIAAAICAVLAAGHELVERKVAVNPPEADSVLIPVDRLSPEGSSAALEAKLKEEEGLSAIAGETLEFVLDEKVVGQARTGPEGVAGIEFTPPGTGDYVFSVRLASDSKRVALPAPLTLCVRKKEQEFFITDIDKTISDAGPLAFLLKKPEDIQPMPDSPEVLRALSKKYTIIYLTAREEIFRRKTKTWLADKGFPAGPVYFWDMQKDEFRSGQYKAEMIEKLKKDWPSIFAGAGDQVSDATAYQANGMKAYIFRKPNAESAEDEKDERAEFPEGTIFFTSWKELQKILLPDE